MRFLIMVGSVLSVAATPVSGRAQTVERVVLQGGAIVGTVTAVATGAPLSGATVAVVGTLLAAQTDAGGQYSIAGVPPGTQRVRARMLGHAPADTTVVVQEGQQSAVDLQLRASAIELDPIVATGYAATLKRDLTGAVSHVSAEDFKIKAAPTVTLSSGLQGKAAGIQVINNSGMPGAGARVRIRGTGSISANSEPLYVIDGLPAEQGSSSSDPKSNPLMSVDPSEIESIDVLKDASATAIYGARGANGVVLITTRRGRPGKSRVTLESSAGYQKISRTIPVLNAQQFMRLSNEARANANRALLYSDAQIAAAQTYDYPGMMLRTGLQASQAVILSGGDQSLRYLISGNYTYQEGIQIGSDFKRYGLRLNFDGDVSSRFRWGTSLSLTRVARNAARVENGSLGNSANGIQAAMEFAPFSPPKDAAGNWIKTSPTTEPVPNPVANALEQTDLNTSSRLLGNVVGEFDITSALKLRTTLGGNFQFNGINFFSPRTILDGGSGGSGWVYSSQGRVLTNENTATYRRTLGPGSLDLLGGFSVQTADSEFVRGEATNFPTDATTFYALGSGAQPVAPGTNVIETAILSYIARANYNVAGKYLFTLTGRSDGSSRFGENNKWAFFPSGAFAWRISDEGFMRNQSVFSDLKLRVTYGQVGNQAVDPYQSLPRLGTAWFAAGGTEIPTLAPVNTKPNPDLRWEQKTEFNVGVDAAMARNRVTFALDAYRSVTKDLLLSVTLPSTTGFTNQLRNIGSVRNLGLELTVSTVNVERERFSWRSTLNVAGNRNKVVDLGTALDASGNSVPLKELNVSPRTGNFFSPGDIYVVRVGEPLSSINGFTVTGLWQPGDQCYLRNPSTNCIPGEYKIADLNGDSAITAADRTILGQGDPKFYGGLSNTLSYGPFSLDVFLSFNYGNKIINAGNAYGALAIMQNNERTAVLDRWTPQNTSTTVPRANEARPRRLYSTLVEDGSYLRLQTLTLGYRLPAGAIPGAETAQVFLTGQNLWTATDYSGFDPDVNSMGGDSRFGGIDIGAYPHSRTWNFGVSITF
jgi:TonB-linked SusC/RagA family outer membrane protein